MLSHSAGFRGIGFDGAHRPRRATEGRHARPGRDGGGELTLSVAGTIFRAHAIRGSLTGSIAELRAVIALAQAGTLAPTPVEDMPKHRVNDVMAALDAGRVTGRIVLTDS